MGCAGWETFGVPAFEGGEGASMKVPCGLG